MVGSGAWCNECGVNRVTNSQSPEILATWDPLSAANPLSISAPSHLRSIFCSPFPITVFSQLLITRDPTSSISTVGDFNFAVLWMVFRGEKMYAFKIYSLLSFK